MKSFLLTVDVEDWFQVENFKACIPFSSWPSCELRVERNVHRLLDLFDSIRSQETGVRRQEIGDRSQEIGGRSIEQPQATPLRDAPQAQRPSNAAILSPEAGIRATFFVLGWIAERLPRLVREIHARGHEVASHGYGHNLCRDQTCEDLASDLRDSKKLLEDTIGSEIFGYRAPSFSISDDILKVIQACGYRYDSSFNSFAMHGRYGKISLNGYERRGISCKVFDGFYELPISNFELGSRVLPWGGGAYFRLMPFFLFKQGVKRVLSENGAYVFYMHPWEIDADQPDVSEADRFSRFRHYVNLGNTFPRLEKILHGFDSCGFITCSQYLDEQSYWVR